MAPGTPPPWGSRTVPTIVPVVTCACAAGYAGTPPDVACADVDECATGNGGCGANAVCTNTDGGRTCACVNGATGDGITCTAALPLALGLLAHW